MTLSLVEINFFMPENTEVSFYTSEEKQLSNFNMAVFSKFFGDVIRETIR